jgi:8-oxo-dGTP pyrophosphatase MutT (NUDIX family)
MPIELRKVIAYVTRQRDGQTQLLVFTHRGIPEAGVQVPAGTVEDGEDVAAAVVRELEEESGLSGLAMRGPIDVYQWDTPSGKYRMHRHVFHFTAADDIQDEWTIEPRGEDEENQKLIFDFRWMPIEQAHTLSGEQGRSIQFVARASSP